MKLATYNLQNIFYRHTDLIGDYTVNRLSDWKEEFDSLQIKNHKNLKELDRLRELAVLMGFHINERLENIHLEKIDGQIYCHSSVSNLASNQNRTTNWYGWAKAKSLPIPVTAITNKSKVILYCNADILVVQEVESRLALSHFNKVYLKEAYSDIFFMEGNSSKSCGMGILLKKGFNLKTMNSFANEKDSSGNILFENDLQLYMIKTPDNNSLFIINVLLNYGSKSEKIDDQFKKIYALVEMCSLTTTNIVLTGTLGLPSYNKYIKGLIENHSLRQINTHSNFKVTLDQGSDASYYRMGAYAKGINIKQKDYLLVSQELFKSIQACGLNRKGVWPRQKPKWNTYKSMTQEMSMASEHPLLWSQFS